MRVVWLILSDWPQVPVLSQRHSSQKKKKALSRFSLLHLWIEKKHHLHAITGKLVQTCRAVWQLHAALIAVALQLSHFPSNWVFTQITHAEDDELSFLSFCLRFFFFFFNIFDCRITQTSLDDVQQKWEEGRGGYRAQEEPITLWCRSRWRQEYFFIWMMLKEWHQLIKKKRFDEQKLHLRWGEGGEAVDNVFQCSSSQHC